MELLIPGLILVALMIYASTRIKRSAARAFEAETIETDEFIIQKPEGFLNVIGGDPKFAFEAYSKDFGGYGAENIRLATANVVVKKDTSVEAVKAEMADPGGKIIDDHLVEQHMNENGVDFRVLSKLAERNGNVFIFTIRSIAETTPEFMRNIEAMFDSFELK